MIKPDKFELYEVLDKETYESTMRYADRRWEWFDNRAIISLNALREWGGKALINDWYWGGDNQWGGLRTLNCPIGALYSQHKFGRAFDPKFINKTADEARHYIMSNQKRLPFITCIEKDVDWLHFDTRNYDGLLIV